MPITFPQAGNKERDFNWESIDEFFSLEEHFSLDNIVILKPQPHSSLNEYVSYLSPTFGFVPSIHDWDYPNMQLPSSSKFFDYQACGLPCLMEWNVPESIYKDDCIIYRGSIRGLNLNKFKLFDKNKILNSANQNHYSDARSRDIIKFLYR